MHWILISLLLWQTGCGVNDNVRSMDATMQEMNKNTERVAAELEADRAYIKLLTEQLKNMSESLALMQQMSTGMFGFFKERFAASAQAAPSSTVKDVLGDQPPTRTQKREPLDIPFEEESP